MRDLKVGYVLALQPSHAWWHPETEIGSKHSAAPGSQRAQDSQLAGASVEEVVRLSGLRMWVEQSYKQVKHASSLVRVSSEE